MRFPGSKYPGHRVVREVRKGEGSRRFIVFYGGHTKKSSKKDIGQLARDRGFDLYNYRYRNSGPDAQRRMLAASIEWQKKAKVRWLNKLKERRATITNPEKRRRIDRDIARLAAVKPRSPHTGAKPVSAYLKRYWN